MCSDAVPDASEWERLARSFENKNPEDILRWAFERFGKDRFALVSSFQAEAMVLLDIAAHLQPGVRVITIDTGRLPDETYGFIDRVREHYDIRLEVIYPNADLVAAMTTKYGVNLFYRGSDLRKLCCHVRKVQPLARALQSVDAWATGLRRDQTAFRTNIPKIGRDPNHADVVKLCPLADWSWDDVWDYIRTHNVPYHPLYDRGYLSIGCAPCTRPVQTGEDPRSGRWWWEETTHKECGLHLPGTKDFAAREVETWLAGGNA